jgi:hypothetical protein
MKTKMGVSQGLAAVAATLLAITFCTPAAARSGNDMIKACHGVLEIDRPGANEALIQGVCMGTVFTLMQLGPTALGFCPPSSSTNYQGVRVVLKFVEDKPERLNEEFVGLAIDALRQAWPCAR